MIGRSELEELMEILENCSDEELSVSLLKRLNDLTSAHGKLILNLDKTIPHAEWKRKCDDLTLEIEDLVEEIRNL
jgi:hypothetical protein